MRLGLYHEPIHTDGTSYDTYGPYARYVLEFARHFDHVTVFAPTTDRETYFSGVPMAAPNVTIAALPFFSTHAQAYWRSRRIIRTFRRHAGELDAINARGTAPLAYVLWWLTRRRGVPFIYHFASDPFELIANSPRYRGLRGVFAQSAYWCEFQIQKFIMRRNYSFTSGTRLYRRLERYTPNVEPVFTSSLMEADYRQRADCCHGEIVRVLYVGYLRHGKGLDFLLEATRMLRRKGRPVEVDIVGSGEQRGFLEDRASELGVDRFVRFHGAVRMGPELNAHYDAADVFVLPSNSEGSPKVILEAMAHSLPVVATNVGSIDEMLDDGRRGVLVAPRSPGAIADGISRIIDQPHLRATFMREGFRFAKEHGLEDFVRRMARRIRQMVLDRREASP